MREVARLKVNANDISNLIFFYDKSGETCMQITFTNVASASKLRRQFFGFLRANGMGDAPGSFNFEAHQIEDINVVVKGNISNAIPLMKDLKYFDQKTLFALEDEEETAIQQILKDSKQTLPGKYKEDYFDRDKSDIPSVIEFVQVRSQTP